VTPFEEALSLLGDRWTLALVDALRGQGLRFQQLQEALPGIATNILTARLRRLEEGGLLLRRAYSQRPPRAEYRLTPDGEEAADLVKTLRHWSARTRGGQGTVTHTACGTAAEPVWWCPTCDLKVDPQEPPVWV